jgi:Lon protease-like protein
MEELLSMVARPLAMFPLSTVLFPHADLPLHVFEPRYRALVRDCLYGDGAFGVVLITRGSEVGGGDQRTAVGTVARIGAALPSPDGRWMVAARGAHRFRVTEWLPDSPYPRALVQDIPVEPSGPDPQTLDRAAAQVRRLRALLSELGEHPAPMAADRQPGEVAEPLWRLCATAPLSTFDLQRLLEAPDWKSRSALLIDLAGEMADDLHRLLAQRSGPADPTAEGFG